MLAVTDEEVRGTFNTLSSEGLIATTDDESRVVALPPELAGEVVLLRRMSELQAARVEFARLAEEYRTSVGSTAVNQLIEVVPKESVPRLNAQLQHQADNEVMWVNAKPFLAPVVFSERDEFERLAQGVVYRCIYARSTLDDGGMLDIIRRDLAAGEQARVLDQVPLKMGIVDHRVGLLPLMPGRHGATTTNWLVVHRCSLLDALIALFEAMWLSALPLDGVVGAREENGSGRADLQSDDLRLLTLLLSGITDEAVGRQLG